MPRQCAREGAASRSHGWRSRRQCAREGAASRSHGWRSRRQCAREGAASRSHGWRARRRCVPWSASWPAMEFPSCYGSSDLLWNSIAIERVCRGSAPGRARQAAAMEGGRGGGAPGRALHRLLWNSRAGATVQWRTDHQSLHFAPACRVQYVAHNGISPAKFQRVMDQCLLW
jgi:hypothetical protein